MRVLVKGEKERALIPMRIAAAAMFLQLLYSSCSCYGEDKTAAAVVEVVGFGECSDCQQTNAEPGKAFQRLRVTVDCKTASGGFRRRGVGALNEQGRFPVSLGHEMVRDGKLKEDCYAQLHSASAKPCPVHDSFDSGKVVFKSKEQDKHTFGLVGKLKFSQLTCASAFLWPYFNCPPLPPFYTKPLPPPVPVYVKPLPPPSPAYKNPPASKPPVIKKPCPPIPQHKLPLPPPTPVYEKPLPPPVPVPIYKPLPPIPVYNKPVPPPIPIYKPLRPIPKFPPFYKPPCPPLPQLPSLPKIPPYPRHP